ncbi:putative reverse transcriptase domain-containing protein [Tanacetum coccineum]
MASRSTIWGQAKRSRMGDLCPSAPSAIFTTMARALLEVPQYNKGRALCPAIAGVLATTNVFLILIMCNTTTPKMNGCFECGAPRHFKKDCPKLKNKDGRNGNAQGWVYAVGKCREEKECIGKLRLQCRHSSLIDIAPTLLENSYDVELADGKIVRDRTYNNVAL